MISYANISSYEESSTTLGHIKGHYSELNISDEKTCLCETGLLANQADSHHSHVLQLILVIVI